LAALDAAGPGGATPAALAASTGLAGRALLRVLLWLLKYDFAEEAPP
jgi:hypothetical protein